MRDGRQRLSWTGAASGRIECGARTGERESRRVRERQKERGKGQGKVKKRGRRKEREAAWGDRRRGAISEETGEEREAEARGAGTCRAMCVCASVCATKRGVRRQQRIEEV